jgi:hypothetical protein
MLNFHRQYFYGMTFFSNKFYVSFSNESATRISTHNVRAQEGWLNTGILLKTKQKKTGQKISGHSPFTNSEWGRI